MKGIVVAISVFLCASTLLAQKQNVFLIPGQGSDYRIFKNFELDTAVYDTHHVHWIIPERKENMLSFAQRMAEQIDTSQNFILIGVSLGGMIATEITDFLSPDKTILISSAKCRSELPPQYKFQKSIPVHALVPKRIVKGGSKIAQPLFERDRKKEKATCKAMLKDKNPVFLKRTVRMIIRWERTSYDENIVHIHGNNDHTLPMKRIDVDHVIEDGSHMMTLTDTKRVQTIIENILAQNQENTQP